MIRTAPTRANLRRAPTLTLIGLAVALMALIATVGDLSGASLAPSFGAMPGTDRHGGLDEADGLVPDGASVFDATTPAVVNLDPRLLDALQRAATDAARDDVELRVTSGWRSREYQEQLFRDAIAEHGSREEAARWVATADTSAHVSGDAVDIGPSRATAWLLEHGPRYGLCQIYGNEPWHYELRPEAAGGRCPRMYANPTHDPRLQG